MARDNIIKVKRKEWVTEKHDVVYRMILKYNNKRYLCDSPVWIDDITGYKGYYSGSEPGGVRTCDHDYAVWLPEEVTKGKKFGCDNGEIELIDGWFYDTIKKIRVNKWL